MSYELTERIIAVTPEAVEVLFPQLLAQYGEVLPDGEQQKLTIGAHWDDTARTRIRAASLTDGTITGQPLTDGRVAFRCLWQSDLAKDYDEGKIDYAEELTQEQFVLLRVVSLSGSMV